MALQCLAEGSLPNAPESDGAIVGCGCERLAVVAEAQRVDASARPSGERSRSAVVQVEKSDAAVGVAEGGVVRRWRQRRRAANFERLRAPQGAGVEEERSPLADH